MTARARPLRNGALAAAFLALFGCGSESEPAADGGSLCTGPAMADADSHPPRAPSSACSADELDAYYDACLDPAAFPIACQQFTVAHDACSTCLLSSVTDVTWGPLVSQAGKVVINVVGCFALMSRDAGSGACESARAACGVDATESDQYRAVATAFCAAS